MKKILLYSLFPMLALLFTACGDKGDKAVESLTAAKNQLTAQVNDLAQKLQLSETQRAAAEKTIADKIADVDNNCKGIQKDTTAVVTAALGAASNTADAATRAALNQQAIQIALAGGNNNSSGIDSCKQTLTQTAMAFQSIQGGFQNLFDSNKALETTIKGLVAQYVIPAALTAANTTTTATSTNSTATVQNLTQLLDLGSQATTAMRSALSNAKNASSQRFNDVAANLLNQADRGLKSTTPATAQAYASNLGSSGSARGLASGSVGSNLRASGAASSNSNNSGMRTMKQSFGNKEITLVY